MRVALLGLGLLLLTSPASALLMDLEPGNNAIGTTGIDIDVSGELTGDFGLLSLDPGDVDFIGIDGLSVGDVITITTTPLEDPLLEDPDTVLGLFNAMGDLLAFSDDAPNDDATFDGLGSLIRFVVDEAGMAFVGISGFGDTNFDGSHTEDGRYIVSITVFHETPEPGVLALFAGAAALLLVRRRSA